MQNLAGTFALGVSAVVTLWKLMLSLELIMSALAMSVFSAPVPAPYFVTQYHHHHPIPSTFIIL